MGLFDGGFGIGSQLLHNRGQSTYGDRAALVKRLGEAMRKELRSERIWVAGRGQSLRRGAAVVVYQVCGDPGGMQPSGLAQEKVRCTIRRDAVRGL